MSHKPLQFSKTMIDENGVEFERVEVFAGSVGQRISGYVDIPFYDEDGQPLRLGVRRRMIEQRHHELQLQSSAEQALFKMEDLERRQNFAIRKEEFRQARNERLNRLHQEAPTPQHMSYLQRKVGNERLFEDLVAQYTNPRLRTSAASSRGSSEAPLVPPVATSVATPDVSITHLAPRANIPQAIDPSSIRTEEITQYYQVSPNNDTENDTATLPIAVQARIPQVYHTHGVGSVAPSKKKSRIEHRSSSLET